MKMFLLVFAVYMAAAQRVKMSTLRSTYINSDDTYTKSLESLFTDQFSCFHDGSGVYSDFLKAFYGTTATTVNVGGVATNHYCCGTMANGMKQCDLFDNWSLISGSYFSLCETTAEEAFRTETSDGRPRLRRDLCCDNEYFTDCTLCKSFMVWDFTVYDEHGGDLTLQTELEKTHAADAAKDPSGRGKVTDSNDYEADFVSSANRNPQFDYGGFSGPYPPYAYANQVFPLGYARGVLREFNTPPVCVYAPNTAGRVIEVKVEPVEAGNQVCVDDLHEDSLERNNPGVTQACDDTRLRTCFPDASVDTTQMNGFAFLISCSESCADADVDLWFRVRASTNMWQEAGVEALGTDRTELNTEMWCMWGISDMRDDTGEFSAADGVVGLENLDGDFSKWDRWPSDLAPDREPAVRPINSGAAGFSTIIFAFLLAVYMLQKFIAVL